MKLDSIEDDQQDIKKMLMCEEYRRERKQGHEVVHHDIREDKE
jgi:hypothetical protein